MCSVTSTVNSCHCLDYERNNNRSTQRHQWSLTSTLEDVDFADNITFSNSPGAMREKIRQADNKSKQNGTMSKNEENKTFEAK